MKDRKNNDVGTNSTQVTRIHSAKVEQGETSVSTPAMNGAEECLMKMIPAIVKVNADNADRDEVSFREALIDLRGERVEGDNTRFYQNEAGFTITERFSGNIVIYRKTLRPNGSYVAEYFDGDGVLARRIKVFCCGRIDDLSFNAEGKKITGSCLESVKLWLYFQEQEEAYSEERKKDAAFFEEFNRKFQEEQDKLPADSLDTASSEDLEKVIREALAKMPNDFSSEVREFEENLGELMAMLSTDRIAMEVS